MKKHEFQKGRKSGKDLQNARVEIDRVDKELIRLLKQRMEAVRAVGDLKSESEELPFLDSGREREVLQSWVKEARTQGLSEYFTGRILREILNYSRRSQERGLGSSGGTGAKRVLKVGIQGSPSCYSDLACTKLFTARGDVAERKGYSSFALVANALDQGEIDYALLPVENSVTGSIGEVNQLLVTRNFSVVDEETLPVEHCLVGLRGAQIGDLREVRSHPVALGQCQRLFSALPHVSAVGHFDTADAARWVRETGDPTLAAIASSVAAERYGLTVLREDVADRAHNQTRFLLLSKTAERVDSRWPGKTTLTFTVKDRSGALAACLKVLADHDINMTRLESRAEPETPWEYMFLADITGYAEEEHVAAALGQLRPWTNHLHVLGSYPSRALEEQCVQLPEQESPADADGTKKSAVAKKRKQAGDAPAQTESTGSPLHALAKDGHHSVVRVGSVEVGSDRFALILGPCAVESRDQIHEAAAMVRARGAHMLRGGAFKPRSSPYSFQGLGFEGLELLAEAGRRYELPVVTEVLRPEDVQRVAREADVLQVGARNMQNTSLLKELGRIRRPVLLKRAMSATIEELLQAAEYVMAGGNHRVILCERGIRTFETATRNTLDLSAVPVLKARTHLPIIVDPSHAAGVRELVLPLAFAAAAVGADGLIVECHPDPAQAMCDKDQALTPEDVDKLVAGLRPILASQGREL